MSQATITTQLGTGVRTAPSRGYLKTGAAVLIGAALAVGGMTGVNAYRASVAASEASAQKAAIVQFIASERAENAAAALSGNAGVIDHLKSERNEPYPQDLLTGVPAFLKSERDEAPAGNR
jgi:2-methylcitrate dehydratase PrpD